MYVEQYSDSEPISLSEDTDVEVISTQPSRKKQKLEESVVDKESLQELMFDSYVNPFPLSFVKDNTQQFVNLLDKDASPYFKCTDEQEAARIQSSYQSFRDERLRGVIPSFHAVDTQGPLIRVGFYNLDSFGMHDCLCLYTQTHNGVAMVKDVPPKVQATFNGTEARKLLTSGNVLENLRKRTCQASILNDVNADILAVSEVENSIVLDEFNRILQHNMGYRYSVMGEGSMANGMNVGILSRFPILNYKLHKDEQCKYIFPKGIQEVDLEVSNTIQTVYVCHLKALLGPNKAHKQIATHRWQQQLHLSNIIDQRWAKVQYTGNYIILGDFNNIPNSPEMIKFFKESGVVTVCSRLPPHQQWTHVAFNRDKKKKNSPITQLYRQLDYIAVSRGLADAPDNKKTLPMIVRTGLSGTVKGVSGQKYHSNFPNIPRFRVSDHCPVAMDQRLQNMQQCPAMNGKGVLVFDNVDEQVRLETRGIYQDTYFDQKPAPKPPKLGKPGWIYIDLNTVQLGKQVASYATDADTLNVISLEDLSSDSDDQEVLQHVKTSQTSEVSQDDLIKTLTNK